MFGGHWFAPRSLAVFGSYECRLKSFLRASLKFAVGFVRMHCMGIQPTTCVSISTGGTTNCHLIAGIGQERSE
jgi:hypothetical protein